MPPNRTRNAAALTLFGLSLCVSAVAQDDPRSVVEEKVSVRLAEVKILVTDKAGNAITDLRKEEIRVRERGKDRRIAALEPFASGDLSATVTTQPMPLYTSAGERLNRPEEADEVWPAPAAQRHIVLLFDAYNSRTPQRKPWIDAGHDWVRDEMRPGDRVALAVVGRAEIDLVVPFTDDKDKLEGYLTGESLVAGEAYYDYMDEIRTLLDNLKTCVSAYEPDMCALSATQPYLFEWRTRTNQTVGALRRFAASLAAIPGRKAVFYMSDGLVVNPGDVATHAVLATLGSDVVAFNRTSTMLAQDSHFDMLEALRVAAVSDVTFFTFDTRRSSMRDVSWTAEERTAVHERTVADPYAVMFDATRGSLDTMSIETGGRSYHGPSIDENLPRAIRAIEGLYTVAYYRDTEAAGDPRVKVSVGRKGARVSSLRAFGNDSRGPSPAQMEIAVAKAQHLPEGLVLPVLVQVPTHQLSFSDDGGTMTSDVALYGEAIAATGERVADVFETVRVSMPDSNYRELDRTTRFGHTLYLAVSPGSYRLRVRFSEAEFRYGSERAVDVTVGADGTVTAANPKE